MARGACCSPYEDPSSHLLPQTAKLAHQIPRGWTKERKTKCMLPVRQTHKPQFREAGSARLAKSTMTSLLWRYWPATQEAWMPLWLLDRLLVWPSWIHTGDRGVHACICVLGLWILPFSGAWHITHCALPPVYQQSLGWHLPACPREWMWAGCLSW